MWGSAVDVMRWPRYQVNQWSRERRDYLIIGEPEKYHPEVRSRLVNLHLHKLRMVGRLCHMNGPVLFFNKGVLDIVLKDGLRMCLPYFMMRNGQVSYEDQQYQPNVL